MSAIRLYLLILAVLLTIRPPPTLAQGAQVQPIGTLDLSVDCYSDPEVTTIVNNTQRRFLVDGWTIGSIYQPRPNEPFLLRGVLEPGATFSFQTGRGAPPSQGQHIYENDAPDEGVRLTTEFGVMEVLCSEGRFAFQLGVLMAPAADGFPRMPRTGQGSGKVDHGGLLSLAIISGTLLLVAGFARRGCRAAERGPGKEPGRAPHRP